MKVIPQQEMIARSRNPRIDWSNQINNDLIFCAPLGSLNRDVVGDRIITKGSGAALSTDYRGESLKASGSAAVASVPINLSPYTAITISFWMWWNAFANDDKLAMEFTSNGANQAGGFFIDPNSSDGKIQIMTSSTFSSDYTVYTRTASSGVWNHYTVAIDRSLPLQQKCNAFYVNGIAQSGTGANVGTVSGNFANSTLYIFSRNNSSLFGAGRMQNLCIRSGVNKAAAIAEVEYKNPWRLFQPDRRGIYFDFGAAGVDLSANAQSSATATGSVTSNIAISGASVALATATGVINQTVGLTGSAASITIANGVATITTTLAGDGFVETFASGALNNVINAAGSAQSAASASGSLGAAASLSANATAQSTATGNVNLSLSLSGSAVAQALASANLDAGTQNGLSGDAKATTSTTGALFSTLSLSGTAPITVTGSGGLTSTHALSGSALSVSSASGDISIGVGGLSVNAIAEALAGGSISLSVSLAAEALSRAVSTAMLTMAGAYQIPVGVYRMTSVTPRHKLTHITPQRTIRSLTRAH